MKKYAYFLPQFHEIKENNKWWGEGFTEWDNIKNSRPLFKGHNQQLHPLKDNYYNLLDKETVIWQTKLLDKYHIDGLIYYHYYFKGRKLLETPAENLLQWKDIKQNFFFCWANHDWKKKNGSSEVMLMEQEYGNKDDWEIHFQYLLPFFMDSRYVKQDNEPLFLLYEPDFPEKKEMMDYFNKRCQDYGFDGLYLIETYKHMGQKGWADNYRYFKKIMAGCTKRVHIREHNTSMQIRGEYIYRDFACKLYTKLRAVLGAAIRKPYVHRMHADSLYREMIEREPSDPYFIHGIFFEWDNTPRYGRQGSVIFPPSKKMLDKFMNRMKDNDMLFINAWNEWGEGMVLEPSKEEGYKYLEYLRKW